MNHLRYTLEVKEYPERRSPRGTVYPACRAWFARLLPGTTHSKFYSTSSLACDCPVLAFIDMRTRAQLLTFEDLSVRTPVLSA